jgi:hypothetical protein
MRNLSCAARSGDEPSAPLGKELGAQAKRLAFRPEDRVAAALCFAELSLVASSSVTTATVAAAIFSQSWASKNSVLLMTVLTPQRGAKDEDIGEM